MPPEIHYLHSRHYMKKWTVQKKEETRSTPRAQTSMAEADHYSDIAHCKNVEPWL